MGTTQRRNPFCFITASLLLTLSSPAAGLRVKLRGSTRCSGIIEIYDNSTVCGDGWDINDAKVVCRQFGCGTAQGAPQSTSSGEGNRLSNLACSGHERSLAECKHGRFGERRCEEAGVVCSGSLPKPSIYMDPAVEVPWGREAVITCLISTQPLNRKFILEQPSGLSKEKLASLDATFRIHKVDFIDEGSYQCHYEMRFLGQDFKSPRSDSVRLSIVRLQQPSISLTSPNRGLVWGPEGAEVTWGYSFVFTCSTDSVYSEGRFFLIFSGSDITLTKPASNRSASFDFPAAESGHQGNYSCVYQVSLSSSMLTSTTAPIRVTIKLPLLLLVSSVSGGFLLLLLLVLAVVCLVLRRQRRAEQPGAQTKLTMRNSYEDEGEEDEEERDYVNVEAMDTSRKQRGHPGGVDDEDSDHDYEEADNYVEATGFSVNKDDNRKEQDDREESSDDENDYVNVTQSFTEQAVDIYGEDDDIYQNP